MSPLFEVGWRRGRPRDPRRQDQVLDERGAVGPYGVCIGAALHARIDAAETRGRNGESARDAAGRSERVGRERSLLGELCDVVRGDRGRVVRLEVLQDGDQVLRVAAAGCGGRDLPGTTEEGEREERHHRGGE